MKYYIFFHLVTGRDVRATVTLNSEIDFEKNGDDFVNELVSKPYLHFMENGKLVVVNMSNVASIQVAKVG